MLIWRNAQLQVKNREIANKLAKTKSIMDAEIDITENTDLNDIKWVGQSTKRTLIENWIKNKNDLLSKTLDEIKKIVTSPIALNWIKKIFINKT